MAATAGADSVPSVDLIMNLRGLRDKKRRLGLKGETRVNDTRIPLDSRKDALFDLRNFASTLQEVFVRGCQFLF